MLLVIGKSETYKVKSSEDIFDNEICVSFYNLYKLKIIEERKNLIKLNNINSVEYF